MLRLARICCLATYLPYHPETYHRYAPAGAYHRQSIRLDGFDYTSPGAYFVTIVTQNRECLFGDVVDGVMVLNELGRMVDDAWNTIPTRFPNVTTDAWIIMPNHVHGVIVITNVGAGFPRPDTDVDSIQGAENAPLRRLGDIVRLLKYQSTQEINVIRQSPGVRMWQRNYYERIIRNDAELNRIRQYIVDNPKNWETDEDNPQRRV